MREGSHGNRWLWIILGLALVLRLGAAVAVQKWVERTPGRLCLLDGDAEGYWQLGRKIARGEEYAVYDPPRRVLRMPGFPLLIAAGIRLFGEDVLRTRILLAIVGTAACGLVYRLAAELFDRSTALRACLLAAAFPTFVMFSVLLLSETLFAAFVVASLIAMTRLLKSQGDLRNVAIAADAGPASQNSRSSADRNSDALGAFPAVVSDLLNGLATLVRPTWLLVGPGFVALYILRAHHRRRAALHGGVLLATLALTLAPWTLRNWRVTGHPIPTTLWVGPSLYDGLHPGATGASDMRFVETDGVYRSMSEYDADRYYRRAAWQFVRENPGRTVWLAFVKLGRFWNPIPNAAQFGHWAIAGAVALCTMGALLLAFWGGWRVRQSLWTWSIPVAPILYFSLVHLVFVSSLRYRLPVEYPLMALAAAGWSELANRRPRPASM